MSKTAVKIAIAKVIASLEAKLAELKSAKEQEEAKEAKFQAELAKWQDKVKTLALKEIEKADRVSMSKRYNGEINIDIYFPSGSLNVSDSPERKDRAYINDSEIQDIEQTIRILKMSDDEFVSASTLKSISHYL